MLDLGHVVLFKNLDTSNLQASLASVFQFFTETYDSIAKRKTDRAYEVRAYEAVNGKSAWRAERGCWVGIPSALDGFDVSYRTDGVVSGHDVFGNDERDAQTIAALARNP